VEVPKLVGMTTRAATNVPADQGLHWRITHKTTTPRTKRNHVRQLQALGCKVTLEPATT
jgi:hypothetical protein